MIPRYLLRPRLIETLDPSVADYRGWPLSPEVLQAILHDANVRWQQWAIEVARSTRSSGSWHIIAVHGRLGHSAITELRSLRYTRAIDRTTAILPEVAHDQVALMALHCTIGCLRTIDELDAIAKRYGNTRFFPHCGHTECIDDPEFGQACLEADLKACKVCEGERVTATRDCTGWLRCAECQKRLGYGSPRYQTNYGEY